MNNKNYCRKLDCDGTPTDPTACFYYESMEPIFTNHRTIHQPSPSLLRWTKVDFDNTVTWSVDWTNSPLPFTDAQLTMTAAEQFEKITCICDIQFVFLPGIVTTSDIELFFEPVDGAGSTLAFVFQPSVGVNMQACGVCGPVHFDQAENFSLIDFGNVCLHELGHSMGLSHTTDIGVPTGNNVMDPFYIFGSPEFQWGPSDVEQHKLRYPYK